ncbi:MAG: D-sedoheptulose 7-phosphate isomerase [Oceanidesulfovibrio sp.]
MSQEISELIGSYGQEGAVLREAFFTENAARLEEIARIMAVSLADGGKILYCGNGGSAADSQHLAAELVNRFQLERPPLPGIALTTDTSALTAIGNDYGFDQVFRKQVQGLGKRGDVLVAISTSGNSENLIQALKAAADMGMVRVGLLGGDGGEMAPLCQHSLIVPSKSTPLVQEVQIAAGHMLCKLIDYFLFENVSEITDYLRGEFSGVLSEEED